VTDALALPAEFVAAVEEVLGPNHVLSTPDMRAPYETDWTRRFQGSTPLVLRPGSTDEVSAVLALCSAHNVAVVPQGGNTGLVGGSVPLNGEVVISLRRLNQSRPVDAVAGQVEVGAGLTLVELQEHARLSGFEFGVDMASRGSATVGGMIATNAGGMHVLRNGPMRAQLLGIEAVLANGDVVRRMSGVAKDSSGYDLPGLFCGSEGTLAVVTAALLKLVPAPAAVAVALVGLPSLTAALAAVSHLRTRLTTLRAAEVFFEPGLALVRAHTGLPAPFAAASPVYVLFECAGAADPAPALAEALLELDGLSGSAIASGRAEREALWAYRERHTESVNAAGIPHKLDVAVPAAALTSFEKDLRTLLGKAAPEATLVLFGHLAEANLHVNILGLPVDDETVDGVVLELVAQYGGTISSEHGVGTAKTPWLGLTRTREDLAAMRAIKDALDPKGILNPGVLLAGR
jgi:FAD/FMN-containing dehydrogenase